MVEAAAALPERSKTAFGDRAVQLEKAQAAGLTTLAAISSYLDADEDLPTFFTRVCATIAEQTHARRAAFWRLGPRGFLSLQPAPFGFEESSNVHHLRFELGARDEGVLERIVFGEEALLANGTFADLDALWHEAGLQEVNSSIAAPWRAGQRSIGVVAVYDSEQAFASNDLWLLRLVGMAAGLLWQYKEAEDDLGHAAVRLEEAMTARRHLLNNIAAGGDEARRRFASALHDDSLQLLTGAELQLERARIDAASDDQLARFDQLHQTLRKVEDSLRRLLVNVSPEPLQLPNDLREAISERLEQLRLRAGIETHVDYSLPKEVPLATQAIVVKNIAEALNNVEKHARATRVTVVVDAVDGGIKVEVSDNGTGFVVAESVRMPGHIGLTALRERAQLAGGSCHIESEPGAGTRIVFWVPMTP